MFIIETIFAFGFMLFYVSFLTGQVDFTFVRVAPTGETEPMGEIEMPMPELGIQHATGTTGYHEPHDYRQRRIRKVPNTL